MTLRIIPESPLQAFSEAVHLYRDSIYRIWLITPWIGVWEDATIDPLQLLTDSLRRNQRCSAMLITRTPRTNAAWHRDAIAFLKANLNVTPFFCDILHTKLYVIESSDVTLAMLGSPNFTYGGNTRNLELALELRTASSTPVDNVSATVLGLVRYANDLLSDDSVVVAP